jgi:hypothetical protein
LPRRGSLLSLQNTSPLRRQRPDLKRRPEKGLLRKRLERGLTRKRGRRGRGIRSLLGGGVLIRRAAKAG